MAKKKDYGFKTPVRRSINNVTGHKVGGNLTGGDSKVVSFNRICVVDEVSHSFELSVEERVELFNRNVSVFAIGGYFLCEKAFSVKIRIQASKTVEKIFHVEPNEFEKIGLALSLNESDLNVSNVLCEISFRVRGAAEINYKGFNFGFIDYEYFVKEDVFDSFFNAKMNICVPEQFYFKAERLINTLDTEGNAVLILKSCNRCQRFLPINHFNERKQLAFSNHCSTKAPCSHSLFSSYKIESSVIQGDELKDFIGSTPYKHDNGSLISFYGHQLECKACKKFFVNSALNHLRTSTQHREDALRRRAFELLVRELLGLEWIYHEFRGKTGKEFDKSIWEKFEKKCFNCSKDIKTPKEMDLDHTMPLVNLYPLDESATCLCPTCNGLKSDLFPVDFYSSAQLERLSVITGLDYKLLTSREPNIKAITELRRRIKWFFDDFLKFEEYTKERDGKKAADSILHSLQKVVNKSALPFDLLEEYSKSIC
jgi:hypothetical protein